MDVRFNVTRPFLPVSRDPSEFISCCGSGVVPQKELRISDSGERVLVIVGKRDVLAEVQSWKESCDISLVFARLRAGDPSALNQRKGEFIDCTAFPKNNRDMLNQVLAGRRLFDSLDPDVKKRFDGSFEKWFTTYGDAEWFSNMGVSDDFLKPGEPFKPDSEPIEPLTKE